MIIVIGISPIVLIILGAILILNLPVAAVIALVAITSLSLMGSLAICGVIASQTAPMVRRDPEWTYTINRAYRTEAPPTGWPSTGVFDSPPTYEVDKPKTYKRMIGRRVVEYDAVTHQPTNGYGRNDLASEKAATPLSSDPDPDPDQTMPIRRVKE